MQATGIDRSLCPEQSVSRRLLNFCRDQIISMYKAILRSYSIAWATANAATIAPPPVKMPPKPPAAAFEVVGAAEEADEAPLELLCADLEAPVVEAPVDLAAELPDVVAGATAVRRVSSGSENSLQPQIYQDTCLTRKPMRRKSTDLRNRYPGPARKHCCPERPASTPGSRHRSWHRRWAEERQCCRRRHYRRARSSSRP